MTSFQSDPCGDGPSHGEPLLDESACAIRYEQLLGAICAQLGAEPAQAEHIVQTQTLRLHEVNFALRMNLATQHLEFFGDCGLPLPHDEANVHRQLLEDALSNDLPGLSFGVHPQSRHVVAKGSIFMPAADDEGWTCAALLLTSVVRIQALQQRLALTQPAGHDTRP